MNFLKHLKLGTMLGLGFAVVIFVGLAVSLYGRFSLDALGKDINIIANERLRNLDDMQALLLNSNLAARDVRNMGLISSESETQADLRRIQEALQANDAISARLNQREQDAELRPLVARVNQTRGPYRESLNEASRLASATIIDGPALERLLLGDLRSRQLEFFTAIEAIVDYERKQTHDMALTAADNVTVSSATLLTVALLAGLAGALIAWAITRQIKRQLGGEPAYAAGVAQRVAEGNLAQPVTLVQGDTSSLLAAMERMRLRLAEVVGQVRQSSEAIATGAGQIASGNADLSQRTEEQASSLEQTAASMEEMTSIVQQSVDNVRTASQLATAASTTALQGGEMVGGVVRSMDEISSSSRKIADIISVIDSIAFQTNILALNAAVEAARAGEQGKGFAVVAGEVRTLAQRSAQAAREIKVLIQDSVSNVEAGARQVGEAGSTMDGIVAQARRVADIVGEIGAATQEQSQGIGQVSDAVNQLDQVTQQNAALVEESAAAAASLNDQAARLVELVSHFQIEAGRETVVLAAQQRRPAPAALGRDTATAHTARPAVAAPAAARTTKTSSTAASRPAALPGKAPATPASRPASTSPSPARSNRAAPAPESDDDWTTF